MPRGIAPVMSSHGRPRPESGAPGGGVGSTNGLGGSRADPVHPSFDPRIDGLLGGVKWRAQTISYSDPDRRADYGYNYYEPLSDFRRVSPDQFASIQGILTGAGLPGALAGFSVEGLTNLGIDLAGRGSGAGALRFANVSDAETAYAYYPDDHPIGGDVFFGASGVDPVLGGYDHFTIIHEIGHTLGLKHGHERDVFGALPRRVDSNEFSVMTYRSFVGADPEYANNNPWDYAQTWMAFDIAALQHMYGADYSTSAGDTVYAWDPKSGRTIVDGVAGPPPGANRVFMTVWDGGGTDTYDLSAYRADLEIDLAPGGSSTLAAGQLAYLGGGPNGGYARGSVFNALLHRGDPRSLIENAIGGSGDDSIRGNVAANALWGLAGADVLRGVAAGDTLYGGPGDDALHGGAGDDLLAGGWGRDRLYGGPGSDTFRFATLEESRPGRGDRIGAADGGIAFDAPGAGAGDLIDVSRIDADAARPGDQAFRFGDFREAGWLWLIEADGTTVVRGTVDARPGWDFELTIADAGTRSADYVAADFIL